MVTTTQLPWTEIAPGDRATLAVDGVEPRFRARPTTAQELADALREADEKGLAVAPRGGASHMGLGNPPSRLDLALETTALDRVVEYEPADLTVTVEAGMRFQALQALLGEQGQYLALDPAVEPEATVGGVVAANVSGPLRFAYGSARDLVIGTRVANPDGRLTKAGGRVVKNVAGYDLNKLYVGSLGTVGVIVQLGFKLAPIPPATGLVVAQFEDSDGAQKLLSAVLHSVLSPLAVELLSPSAAEAAGLPAALSVAVRVGGYPAAVERQNRDLATLAGELGGQVVQVDDDAWERVRLLPLALGRDVLVRAAASISQSTALLDVLQQDLADFAPTVWTHAGNGVAYAALNPGDDIAGLQHALHQARHRVAMMVDNGSLVVEKAPPALKQGFDVWGDPGSGLPLMRALKQQLDPKGTLNPGRYAGGL